MRWLVPVVALVAGAALAQEAPSSGSPSVPPSASVPAPAEPAPPPPSESPQGPRWKSVQVLPGDLPEAELQALMTSFAKELRVRCTHCHVKDDPAAETPTKRLAREHMRLTITLQRDWFATPGAPRVTCNLCHRRRAVPRF